MAAVDIKLEQLPALKHADDLLTRNKISHKRIVHVTPEAILFVDLEDRAMTGWLTRKDTPNTISVTVDVEAGFEPWPADYLGE